MILNIIYVVQIKLRDVVKQTFSIPRQFYYKISGTVFYSLDKLVSNAKLFFYQVIIEFHDHHNVHRRPHVKSL